MIEILTTGAPNSVQDLGRSGLLAIGVGRSGAMDPFALELGNTLLGNDAGAAGIEVALFPFRLRFHADAAFAVTGRTDARLDGLRLPPVWATVARAGQTLELAPPLAGGRAVLAFAGGIDVPVVLGARATDLKSGFGGLDGRGLKRGDRLKLGVSPTPSPRLARGYGAVPAGLAPADASGVTILRTLPAAEYDDFGPENLATFFASDWTLTADANRQGYRLAGPTLVMARRRELFSHGIRPGVVQVPASNQPIIQLADANTCGGYPKIVDVIEADLWRLAHVAVGGRLRFVETTREAAIDALRGRRDEIRALREAVRLAG